MPAPRKHHFVPQLYLRGFARKRSSSWQAVVIDRETAQERTCNIRDIFAQRDFNTITDADGSPNYIVEELLSEQVEAKAAAGLDALRSGTFPLSDEEKFYVAIFMSAQLSRGRSTREGLSEGLSEVMSLALKVSAQYGSDAHFEGVLGHQLSPDVRERLLHNEEHMTIRPSNAALLQATLGSVAEIARILLVRTWSLLIFEKSCLFTGEHPVVHINPHGESTGYGVSTAERLYMPVSPTHALVLSHPWAGWQEAAVAGTDDWARRLNWAMLTQPANNELLRHPEVTKHPLPSVVELQKDAHWPWGPDPASALPLAWHYVRD